MTSAQQSPGATWVEGDFEHPNQDIVRPIKIALVFAYTLSTLAVVLRLVARRMTGSRLFLDDYLILVALFFKYACSSGVVTRECSKQTEENLRAILTIVQFCSMGSDHTSP
jgi:hypothetical protein